MAHDVFISHSSLDKLAADAVCHGLEARGIRCWIAPRDVVPGEFYADAIVHAIDSARLIVLITSRDASASRGFPPSSSLVASWSREPRGPRPSWRPFAAPATT